MVDAIPDTIGRAGIASGVLRWSLMVEAAGAAIWLAFAAEAFSLPEPPLISTFVLLVAGIALAGLWVIRLAVWGISIRRSKRGGFFQRIRSPKTIAGFGFTPLVGVVGLALLITPKDFHLRFALSERALEKHAIAVLAGESPETPSRLGLLPIEGVDRSGNSVRFIIQYQFLFDIFGVYYSPDGPPPDGPAEEINHLHGPWHRFIWSD